MLKRDTLESMANRELGVIMWERGVLDSAIWYFNQSLINDHLNEAGETYSYLASVHKDLGNYEKAGKYLANSIRNKDYFTSSLRGLGQLALMQKNYNAAVDYFEQILQHDTKHTNSRVELAISLRKCGQLLKARELIRKVLEDDPLSFYAIAENWLEENSQESTERLNTLFDRKDNTFVGSYLYLYTSGKYMDLKLWDDALAILKAGIRFYRNNDERVYPLLFYYAGYCYGELGETDLQAVNYNLAKNAEIQYVFPFSLMDQKVLEGVVSSSPDDANALSMLGCLYAWNRQHFKAIESWEKDLSIRNDDPVVYHNLAGAYWKTTGKAEKSTEYLEKAVQIKPKDTRLILELDHLYDYQNRTEDRFKLYKNHEGILDKSDELVLRYAKLNISQERYEEAIKWMTHHRFFPREANHMQPVVITVFMEAHLGLGIQFLKEGSYKKALQHFEKSIEFPEGLNDIPPEIFVTSRLDYYKGLAMRGMGRKTEAESWWSSALTSPSRKGFECDIYRVKMMKVLGRNQNANELLKFIIQFNQEKLETSKDEKQLAMAYIILSEATKEKGDESKAQEYLNRGLLLDRNAIINTRIQSAHVPIIRN
jgi:tetratricopeptide (TPR) repeat protein